MVNKTPAIKKARVQDSSTPELWNDKNLEPDQVPEEQSLYFIVRHGKASLQSVVSDWIDNYKVERDKAILALLQFIISSSGCKGALNEEVINNDDWADVIKKMVEEFKESNGDYPLASHAAIWKKFRTNMSDFLQILIKQCQYSIVYDQYLMNHVISLVAELSDSQVRAFRHTATFIAMKMMTALVDVLLIVSINIENAQRQYNAEQHKKAHYRSVERLEALRDKKKELEENTAELTNMIKYIFRTVFVHRYRDIVPDIRSICMYEIGLWMKKCHSIFLDDSYLKYIGWTINDKFADVRLKCLQSLQPLFSTEQFICRLELFAQKFKDRIIQMTLDKDNDVAVQAVKIISSIWTAQKIWKSDSELLTNQIGKVAWEKD